ncbi:hypothetical protein JCM19232_4885 [Vibrio ishigakensis]|uniref:Uncharacterized protein n=1 Tax=Vibrio ishigakensis TaxID=1481914 RepID=A0A0B8QC82_9VIBR|nr:hypothetical protein [Vibrio ishigakensis]GAM57902.1 hypothetical protein JCM19231_1413 [Vibrio ishigakensis]GAM65538.1 hypothetical protein JCM19232_4885 [Vibrio ishigakensis]GAM68542.1 hypothetical protein JCM19236_864 [Vibrio sp. JCM 19236]GAM76271.1 hypothetical protein JCM19241_569 [Vibrio ishigakensis]
MIYSQHAEEINRSATKGLLPLIGIIFAVKLALIAVPTIISSLHGLGHFF